MSGKGKKALDANTCCQVGAGVSSEITPDNHIFLFKSTTYLKKLCEEYSNEL